MPNPSSAWISRPTQPLLIGDLLSRVGHWAGDQKIVYRNLRELTYPEFIERVARLGDALNRLGVRPGDRIGVMDWDSHRYLELFFAVPMLGAVLHTINTRLSPDHIAYTIAHAEDSLILTHPDFLSVAELLAPKLPSLQSWVLMPDVPGTPMTKLPVAGEYEALLAASDPSFKFPSLDEDTVATLFYTTGTTGEPKGVFFTHRQIVLHTLGIAVALSCFKDPIALEANDVYLPLTPMFHVHAWGVPYVATMLGMKQVFPGRFEPETILKLITTHRVTFSHCVPTILQMLLHHPASQAVDLSGLKLAIGGAPLPKGLARQALARGVHVLGAYGMSETCPVVAASHVKPAAAGADPETKLDYFTRTGFPTPLVEAAIWGEDDQPLSAGRDNVGELVLRAPWLTAGYYKQPAGTAELWRGGWLHTGDIAYRDTDGYIRITDRLKDVIKVGGEWMSSLELENALSQHDAVREVVVVGVPDNKWGERPHADVALRDGFSDKVTPKDLRHFLQRLSETGVIHKRAILTEIRLVESIPRTSVGKADKRRLRAELRALSEPPAGSGPQAH